MRTKNKDLSKFRLANMEIVLSELYKGPCDKELTKDQISALKDSRVKLTIPLSKEYLYLVPRKISKAENRCDLNKRFNHDY